MLSSSSLSCKYVGSNHHVRLFSLILTSNLLLTLILEALLIGVSVAESVKSVDPKAYEDNEFAEFEDTDDDQNININDPRSKISSQNRGADGSQASSSKGGGGGEHVASDEDLDDQFEATVDDDPDDDDSDVFEDPEEFEMAQNKGDAARKTDNLEITKVPIHLRTSWESYLLEGFMLLGLIAYFVNFIAGRTKNQRLADTWFEANRDLLENNFTLVGDDGKKEIENHGLIKETENVFLLWCSGRTCVEGMLTELRFIKRQDLMSLILGLVTPSFDEILIKVYLNQDAMDNYVFCIVNKKTAPKLVKEMNDLATFCPERKPVDKYGINDSFLMMNEIGEVAGILFDMRFVSLLNKNRDAIQYIHISDQYSGFRLPDETPLVRLPERRRIMIFSFKYPKTNENEEEQLQSMKPLMQLVFYLVDKVRRLRLSRESKVKSDKNRQKVEEIFLKATHSQRQEAAQLKREERKRAEKEKILNEEDPEKQRKWEEREHRREMKKKTAKFKQIKIRAM
ncbi:PAT complex subunit CCDC47 [Brevipalpus obovatus]|uniref:PAT complex subunit CCDC47 n=1 Tax=Brevipalpus obovatus TaxID=246614 RepID=UPI003D9DBCF1